ILNLLAGLEKSTKAKLIKDRAEFLDALKQADESLDLRLKAPEVKAIYKALSERDETAQIIKDKDGNIEADSELRDTENVPLKENIDSYFKREVLPHVPDAFIATEKD